MSKFMLGVTAGIAKVYPYGQGSAVSEVLKEGEALLLQVPVGPHPEPYTKTAVTAATMSKESDREGVIGSGVITDPDSVVIPEPPSSPPTPDPERVAALQGMAQEDKAAPAAGVDNDSPPTDRYGTLVVAVLEGTVTLRIYQGSLFSEEKLEQGGKVEVAVTETNRITLAVYEAAPVAEPRK